MKSINYELHEFIKTTELKEFISASMQPVLDILQEKEKLVNAVRSWLKEVDSKQKEMEVTMKQHSKNGEMTKRH
jgi:hypothetical protein